MVGLAVCLAPDRLRPDPDHGETPDRPVRLGAVSFRRTPANNKIIDKAAAVEFVRTWAPERVKVTETVGIKDVLAAREEAEKVNGERESLAFLVEGQPGENVLITTGIEMEKRS